MIVQCYGMTPTGLWAPLAVQPNGTLEQQPPATQWSYKAASGGITNTAAVTLVAAAGVSNVNYLTGLQLKQTSATGTELKIIDQATGNILFLVNLPASMLTGENITFPTPLESSANSALQAQCVTNSTVTYVNAQGYSEGSPQQIQESETTSFGQGAQLLDDSGNNILDDNSAIIFLN